MKVSSLESVAPVASLVSELPPELLRGVSLDMCLRSWGKHFGNKEMNWKETYTLSCWPAEGAFDCLVEIRQMIF